MSLIPPRPVHPPRSGRPTRSGPVRQDIIPSLSPKSSQEDHHHTQRKQSQRTNQSAHNAVPPLPHHRPAKLNGKPEGRNCNRPEQEDIRINMRGQPPKQAPYRARATGFFCFGITLIGVRTFTPDCSSIHASSSVFLNRHRLPSLNAGTTPSDAYRYNESPLMPRYSDACRISITSRTIACTATAITSLRTATPDECRSRRTRHSSLYPLFGECTTKICSVN